jgi:hypothetical protein
MLDVFEGYFISMNIPPRKEEGICIYAYFKVIKMYYTSKIK